MMLVGGNLDAALAVAGPHTPRSIPETRQTASTPSYEYSCMANPSLPAIPRCIAPETGTSSGQKLIPSLAPHTRGASYHRQQILQWLAQHFRRFRIPTERLLNGLCLGAADRSAHGRHLFIIFEQRTIVEFNGRIASRNSNQIV